MQLRRSFPVTPYRSVRPTSSKLIFISCEGVVTEEKYFKILSETIFNDIKSKIHIISVREDFLNKPTHEKTKEEIDEHNRSNPQAVLKRMIYFKEEKEPLYEFDKHPEDEFWLLIDVDDHTDEHHIKEFKKVIKACEAKENKFRLAVTNPFFEFWLYLHHCEVEAEDEAQANTVGNSYFRNKMRDKAGVTLGRKKYPLEKDYTHEKVIAAIRRAEQLHIDKTEKYPNTLGSHVYLLLEELVKLEQEKRG